MRRQRPKNTQTPPSVIGDIKQEVPEMQLAAIGAFALAFNEVEANLDRLFFIVVGLEEHLQLEVCTRIIGIEGKIEIISKGAEQILDNKDWLQLTEATGNGFFGRIKTYRDSVIHARHINPATWIGVKVDRQAHIYDVLLKEYALDAAYNLLVVLRKEIDEAVTLAQSIKILKQTAAGDPKKAPLEAKTTEHQAQFRRYRTERLSLPPIPEFPSESELRAADFQVHKAQTAAVMSWYNEWETPQPLRASTAPWHNQSERIPRPPPGEEK